ncbi:peptidase associated/transthyretin-like domain-containing protein [Robertkochia sediminum]|uniref:hypothetical protein n=1 Tax=Robertkochia sediminum TaxID=2785326 RepID=UPI0019322456|nr:hypothetical protein [Robertkochia sediminum]MBL7474086.1 hypothetical protein [Robertkochia sediminum]
MKHHILSKTEKLQLILLYTCFLISPHLKAQELNGRIFNNDTPLEGITINNRSGNATVYSNTQGYFSIPGKEGDSISFRSNFFRTEVLIVTQKILDQGCIIELKSNDIKLDEVVVKKTMKPKKFEPIAYSKDLNIIIQEDIKKHPEKYRPSAPNYGVNFAYIFRSLLRWFKKNKKVNSTEKIFLSSEDLENAFRVHHLVNAKFLKEELDIPLEQYGLFCEYLEKQHLNTDLPANGNELQFLEAVMENARKFKDLEKE